jgi:hypothetical protein
MPAGTIFKDIDMVAGKVLIEQTDKIPCDLDERFGVLFDLKNLPAADGQVTLKIVWQYPSLKSPSGEVSSSTQFPWPIAVKDGSANDVYFDWGLESPFELAAGQWTVKVYYGKLKLLQHQFTVIGCDRRE